ncbi:glutamine--fructose-6-phosphate transaminase [Sulfurivirga caldicuralii]|uniref:Glutamine--fructose-6-phosphate aminotransferase [isomerizing] n=1 Tax=Sulfurivirga caldicuralii TaxID=364032 RepID=A0A1N6HHZ1_9GAMM|nr:glutamine--fructose-6-phosphate transaminase (isomerizing) [Sulfurivirga caldicuralii]SIO19347.1 glutamine--fructose-6-phosphate transaminase [Sulfurivirga caldicuralii]
MCGIVGGIAERNVVPILLEGLRRLEYRGYDSAGLAVIDAQGRIARRRAVGKIAALEEKLQAEPLSGQIGIAHTRWATHGVPAEQNAHPHVCNQRVAVVHNGIIENYQTLREQQRAAGYRFTSDTDTEVIAHAVDAALSAHGGDLKAAVQAVTRELEGAYALGVIANDDPETLVAVRCGSPLVIGVGIGEYFIASDVSALLPVTQEFIFLDDGDLAVLRRDALAIYDAAGAQVERPVKASSLSLCAVELDGHRHFMHKEIHEQPQAVSDTLEGRIAGDQVLVEAFGPEARSVFAEVERVQIVACGTSYHAGLTARYWLEDILRLPCGAEVASEFRYRNPVLQDNTLFVFISQSGETADTLAAMEQVRAERDSQGLNLPMLAICNVPESSLTRGADLTLLTHAGPEIGVASTKAFTTQLVALALLLVSLGKVQQRLSPEREARIVAGLKKLPRLIEGALVHEPQLEALARIFVDKHNALFLGRGTHYPIAMEGALKLKEISYIHAEAYPAGELKHGPLALVDENLPIVAVAPADDLLEKLKSNLQEVRARGGRMIIIADERAGIASEPGLEVVPAATHVGRITAPITLNIPLQLLAYHVAVLRGTDVDRPRNLAKSVTVE